MLFSVERDFRFWDYTVSHDQLLFRSPKTDVLAYNIDIIFWRVEYVEIPTHFSNPKMQQCDVDEVARVSRLLGKAIDIQDSYCLVTRGQKFVIVAAGYKVLQNELDIFESSLEYFKQDDNPTDLGLLLYHSEVSVNDDDIESA
jgi:hypothetical protein